MGKESRCVSVYGGSVFVTTWMAMVDSVNDLCDLLLMINVQSGVLSQWHLRRTKE